jgi:enoyl-CoA hydratase
MHTVKLEGPGKNALSSTLMRSLRAQLREADGRPVLLTGAGDAFSAGLDLKEVASLDHAGMAAFLALLEEVCRELYLYPGPSVALVNGHAIAGGAVLALCCDARVAAPSPKARIGLNEVAIGLRFPPGILNIMRRQVPTSSYTRVFLEAGLYDVATAHQLGLVDVVADNAEQAATEWLARLAKCPPAAYAATKADLRRGVQPTAEEELRFEQEVVPTWTSPALKEQLLAVLKK